MKAVLCLHDPEEEVVLCQVLRFSNIIASVKHDIRGIINEWSDHPVDLLLVALKPHDAANLVTAIRAATDAPLVVIVELLEEDACIEIYQKGADLVILRPYSHRLLKVQVEALLRRGASIPLRTIPALQIDHFVVEPSTRTLHRPDGTTIVLSHREFQLLYLLFMYQGQILTNERIIESIWGYNGQGDKNMLRSLINRIRKKVEDNPEHPRYLVTVPGVGYQLIA
jgi:two-component system response regulator VicR